MRARFRIISILLFTSFILLWLNCSKQPTDLDPQPDNTKIPETTHVVENDVLDNLISISNNDSIFEFNQTSEVSDILKPGNIIVSDISQKAPTGFLRKVESVSTQNGLFVAVTSQATLTEAIETGSASIEKLLTPADLEDQHYLHKGITLNPDKLAQGNFELLIDVVVFEDPNANAEVKLVGSLNIEPSFTFSLDIDNFQLKELTFINTTKKTAGLDVIGAIEFYSLEKEYEIVRWRFQPITIFIGPFPIVIQPLLSIDVGIDGSARAEVSFHVDRVVTHTAGLRFQNGSWEEISESERTFNYFFTDAEIGTEVKGYIGPQFNLLLYGIAGPYAELNAYMELETAFSNPWWELYAGVELGVGVQMRIMDRLIADKNVPAVIGIRTRLAAAQGDLTGIIGGTVLDAVTGLGIADVAVEIRKDNSLFANTTTDANGIYLIELRADTGYEVEFSKQGYLTAKYENVDVIGNATTTLETVLQIDVSYSGNGDFGGEIVNALTGIGVPDLALSLREGMNNQTGNVIQTTTTTANGTYIYSNVPAGNYTIEANGTGYETAFFTAICIGGQSTGNQNATITPQLNENEYRIILNWGEFPYDLDSHLTGPMSDGTRFHMYYPYAEINDGTLWPGYVTLDLDDVTSYGPETTTLYYTIGGLYRFSVHNYSDRLSTYSTSLSQSNAQVRLYKGSNLINVFYVPSNQEGTLWTVFEMFDDTVIPVNMMTYESSPSGIRKAAFQTDGHLLRNLPPK